MKTRVRKWGNSLGLRIPQHLAVESSISDNTDVELSVEDGRLIVVAATKTRFALNELVDGITSTNLHDEIDTGDKVGKEAW